MSLDTATTILPVTAHYGIRIVRGGANVLLEPVALAEPHLPCGRLRRDIGSAESDCWQAERQRKGDGA